MKEFLSIIAMIIFLTLAFGSIDSKEIENFKTIIILFVLFGIGSAIYKAYSQKQKLNQLKKVPGIHTTQGFVSVDGDTSIGVDFDSKKIVLINKYSQQKIYEFNQIIECEIMEDGNSLISKSTSSMAGRAIVGGVLLGGVGALVGGVTGKSKAKKKVKSIKIKIILKDNHSPVHYLNFLNSEVETSSDTYKFASENAEKWHATIINLMELKNNVISNVETQSANFSVAEEIEKLSELLKKGLITQEEFNEQKRKLLLK